MSKIAFIYPGQGAQKAGMGKDFYENIPVPLQGMNADYYEIYVMYQDGFYDTQQTFAIN